MATPSFQTIQKTYAFAPESLVVLSADSQVIAAKMGRCDGYRFVSSFEYIAQHLPFFSGRDDRRLSRFATAAQEILVNAHNYSFDSNVTRDLGLGVRNLAANVSAAVIYDPSQQSLHLLARNTVTKRVADDLQNYVDRANRLAPYGVTAPYYGVQPDRLALPHQQPLLQEGSPIGPLLKATGFLAERHVHSSQRTGIYNTREEMGSDIRVFASPLLPSDKGTQAALTLAKDRFEKNEGPMPPDLLRSVTVAFSSQL